MPRRKDRLRPLRAYFDLLELAPSPVGPPVTRRDASLLDTLLRLVDLQQRQRALKRHGGR